MSSRRPRPPDTAGRAVGPTGGPPGLTELQWRRVRDLARRALAERGIETVAHDDRLESADGRAFGLDNLASKCRAGGLPDSAWPAVVSEHIDALLGAFGEQPPELTAEQIRAHVHVRLAQPDAATGSAEGDAPYAYARSIGAGFVEMLVHSDGGFVRWLTDDDVAKVGLDELLEIGRENLRAIRPDECELARGRGSTFHVLRGESGFIASKLLLLPEVMRIVAGPRAAWPHGVLVAVPNRYELMFAAVDAAAVANLAGMITVTAYDHAHGQAPLSPWVYWWRDGGLTQLTTAEPAGGVQLCAVADFLDTVDRLLADPGAA